MKRDIPALIRYLADRETMPFAWRANDCVTYAAGAIVAQGGADLLADLPAWSDEDTARAVLAAEGGIVAAVSRRLRSIPPAQAMRGDIGLVPLAEGKFFLAVVEVQALAGPGLKKARRVPRGAMTQAWSAL